MYRFVNSPSASAAVAAANNLIKTRASSVLTNSPKKTLVQALTSNARSTSTSSTTPAAVSSAVNKGVDQKQYSTAPAAAEPFLNGSSSAYVEEMYNSWLQDPTSVHAVRHLHKSPLVYLQYRSGRQVHFKFCCFI